MSRQVNTSRQVNMCRGQIFILNWQYLLPYRTISLATMTRRITWPFRLRRSRSITHETIGENEPYFDDTVHRTPPDSTVEELGQLLREQGRCLDELTNRSRALAAENIVLRERISSGIDNVSISKPCQRDPLSSITNKKNAQGDDILRKFKSENEMLLQQADLLAKELNDAHVSIAERDVSITSLSQELSHLLEKARTLSECTESSLLFFHTKTLLINPVPTILFFIQ